jgi:ABC-2 type transport system ATP-binding protein
MAVFRAEEVTKVFGNGLRANDGLTLRVDPEEVFGLLGPNGAGESTFVKQVIGLLRPTSGEHPPRGRRPRDEPRPPAVLLPAAGATADRCVQGPRGHRTHRQDPRRPRALVRERASTSIEALDIGAWSATLGVKLSGGVKRLVGFATNAPRSGRRPDARACRPSLRRHRGFG